MTHGDFNGVKCPACKMTIIDPTGKSKPHLSEILEQVRKCDHCNAEIRIWARWTLSVDAERESKVK